jgi:lipooligosaccharide transport system permease protein
MESRPATFHRPHELLRRPAVSTHGAVRLWQRNATLYRRSWMRHALPTIVEPLLYLMAMGLGLGLYIGDRIFGVEYVAFIAPGLIAAAAMQGAIFEVTIGVFVKVRFWRLYDAVITTPLEPQDVALGEALWATTRSTLYGTAFLLVTTVLGYIVSPWAILVPAAAALVGMCFSLIGLIVSARMPAIDLFGYFFSMFVMPLFLFSGIFFPVTDLPAAAQPIAWMTPLHHGVELMRALALTGNPASAAGHALWLVVANVILYAPAVNMLKRRLVT